MADHLDSMTVRSLKRTRIMAWASLLWERFWPLVLPSLCVLALFLTVSGLGLWPVFGGIAQWIVLGAFALAFLVSLYPLSGMRLPDHETIDNRIELKTALQHRPVTAQSDNLADIAGSDDPFAVALWKEHRRRAADNLDNLKAGIPVPSVAKRDPFAMRAVVALLLFIGVMVGWGNFSGRIGDAFRSHDVAAADMGRIDAWVKPPAYTNRPPIFLTKTGEDTGRTVTVPEGSEIVIRVLDLENASTALVQDGLERAIEADESETAAKTVSTTGKVGGQIFAAKLENTANVVLRSGEALVREWAFKVIPDASPTIKFVEEPKGSSRGALEFAYEVTDDYGVSKATADIRSTVHNDGDAQPLIDAPEVALPLPGRRAKAGASKTSRDLTAHPWAGADVAMKLTAEDQAGQTGESEAVTFKLPERIFVRPLALAIVEERRRLALDKRNRKSVAEMLDVITTTHPDEFIKSASVYTALRVAFRMIDRDVSDDQLREALELLWDTALSVEDGDLSAAERRLRDAQERLAEALERGASDEEIDKLMEELRQAMNDFMQQLAEQMAKNPNQQAMPLDPNAQVLRQQDLEKMMQRIEDLAKSGSKDAARELLQELQRMMNNLQTARPGQQQQQQDQFSEQMNKLGEMMRQQQELMDETFDMQRRQQQQGQRQQENGQQQQRQGQRQQGQRGQQQGQEGQQPGQGQKPMTPEEFAEAMKQLQKQQGELQKQMQQMQDAMRGMGMEPGEKLGEAGEAMGEAEGQLGQGQPGEATGQQGRALQAMRDGAQQMMQQMQNQAQQQQGQGQGDQRGDPNGQVRNDRDPLGRSSRTQDGHLGSETKVPGEIDAQRARRILDAIRRRLSDPNRPKLELDYLDRLLPTR